MNSVFIRNLSFGYKDRPLFDNFNLSIQQGSWVTIVGPNGSGKSTLVKILVGLLEGTGTIIVNQITLTSSTRDSIREYVGVVFDNPDNQFVSETVADEMAFKLENLGVNKFEIRGKIKETADLIGITPLLNLEPHKLTNGQKQLVILAGAIINNPPILILDEALSKVDAITTQKVLEVIAYLNKKGTTIINITHNLDEATLGQKVVVLNEGEIILNGTKEEVFEHEKVFNALGIQLPFMVDLSLKLKFYGLVDKIIFDAEEMVDHLWK